MKERPIIFSTESVKAILLGNKTQTRRVINPQPECNAQFYQNALDKSKWWFEQDNRRPSVKCPYGQVGDKNFTYFKDSAPPYDGYYEVIWEEGDKPRYVYLRRFNLPDLPADTPTEYEWERWLWGKDKQDDPEAIGLDVRQPELIQWRRVGDRLWVKESYAHYGDELNCGIWKALVVYKADKAKREIPFAHTIPPKEKWWNTGKPLNYFQPSIFMPRWASRITLEITEIRVERVQEATYPDLKKEGITSLARAGEWGDLFIQLWDSLNAKRGFGWEVNPWVWAISFKVV